MQAKVEPETTCLKQIYPNKVKSILKKKNNLTRGPNTLNGLQVCNYKDFFTCDHKLLWKSNPMKHETIFHSQVNLSPK